MNDHKRTPQQLREMSGLSKTWGDFREKDVGAIEREMAELRSSMADALEQTKYDAFCKRHELKRAHTEALKALRAAEREQKKVIESEYQERLKDLSAQWRVNTALAAQKWKHYKQHGQDPDEALEEARVIAAKSLKS